MRSTLSPKLCPSSLSLILSSSFYTAMNNSPPSPSTSSLSCEWTESDDELEAHLRTLPGTEWIFHILDDPDMPSNLAMVTSKPFSSTEFAAATGSTPVFWPFEGAIFSGATNPSTAARHSAAEASSSQAALAPSPKALSSMGAAPWNFAVSQYVVCFVDL
jgi:hypothetical protein